MARVLISLALRVGLRLLVHGAKVQQVPQTRLIARAMRYPSSGSVKVLNHVEVVAVPPISDFLTHPRARGYQGRGEMPKGRSHDFLEHVNVHVPFLCAGDLGYDFVKAPAGPQPEVVAFLVI